MGAQNFDNKIVLINAPIGDKLSIQDWKEFASHTRAHLKSLGLPRYCKATVEIIQPQDSPNALSVCGMVKRVLPVAEVKVVEKPS